MQRHDLADADRAGGEMIVAGSFPCAFAAANDSRQYSAAITTGSTP
jgi:hypothetical protein